MNLHGAIQNLVRKVYNDGDMRDVETETQLESCGDSLFKFLMSELEECSDFEEAMQCVRTAIRELEEVYRALQHGAAFYGFTEI